MLHLSLLFPFHLDFPTPPSTMSSSGYQKLTVPQLKALCKERKLAGYSKLGKPALLQKLAEADLSGKTDITTPSGAGPVSNATTPSAPTTIIDTLTTISEPSEPPAFLAKVSSKRSTVPVF